MGKGKTEKTERYEINTPKEQNFGCCAIATQTSLSLSVALDQIVWEPKIETIEEKTIDGEDAKLEFAIRAQERDKVPGKCQSEEEEKGDEGKEEEEEEEEYGDTHGGDGAESGEPSREAAIGDGAENSVPSSVARQIGKIEARVAAEVSSSVHASPERRGGKKRGNASMPSPSQDRSKR